MATKIENPRNVPVDYRAHPNKIQFVTCSRMYPASVRVNCIEMCNTDGSYYMYADDPETGERYVTYSPWRRFRERGIGSVSYDSQTGK